ncbi:hypothetical protein ANCDUO_16427 [Ancylostoma duodenale]|uniref:Uncharacterized protein n=1 Tax=Ancylostoma duodenale TaxID=51022 RepID=A0A0C2FY00_9BILA|nr:hypothetical protein ANCDUO_16427 [Ancylostoma duodenale]
MDHMSEDYTLMLVSKQLSKGVLFMRSVAEITTRRSKGSELGASIDKAASIGFPVAFAIFNVGYWGYYLSSTSRMRL